MRTSKRELFEKLLSIRNEINDVRGESDKNINVAEYMNTWKCSREIQAYKVYELETCIENAKSSLERAKKEAAVEAWTQTEAGIAYMTPLKEQMDAIYEEKRNTISSTKEMAQRYVKELLGDEFDITKFSVGCIEIGLVKEYKDGYPIAHFGHDFDIYFDRRFFENKDYRWELNYGTMGGFEIDKDTNRVKFLVGLAKFVSDTTIVPQLRDCLQMMAKKIDDLNNQEWQIEKKMNNPVISE